MLHSCSISVARERRYPSWTKTNEQEVSPLAALAIRATPTPRRPRRLRVVPHPARTFGPATLTSRPANGHESVNVSPAAVADRYCWLTVRSEHGDREATAEMLLDGRQVRQVIRMLGRAARSLDHSPRAPRIGRRTVRRGERAFRMAEREWLDEQGVLEVEEDF